MSQFLQYITMLCYILTVIAGGISIYEFIQKKGVPGATYGIVAIGILITALALTFLTSQSGGIAIVPTPGSTVSVPPVSTNPTFTPLVPSPTLTSIPSPIPSPTLNTSPISQARQLAPEGTFTPNTRLRCNCSDPVVVTLIKIEIQPDKNRMIWTFTFSNNTPSSNEDYFGQLTLQEGDQVKYPTTGEATYDATGPGIFNDGSTIAIFLQPNETKQVIVTFSFVPYINTSYTLISTLSSSNYVTFDPVVMSL